MWASWNWFFTPLVVAVRHAWMMAWPFAGTTPVSRTDWDAPDGRGVEWTAFRHAGSNVIFLLRTGAAKPSRDAGARRRPAEIIEFKPAGPRRQGACL